MTRTAAGGRQGLQLPQPEGVRACLASVVGDVLKQDVAVTALEAAPGHMMARCAPPAGRDGRRRLAR
jgi:hypothetical protein